MMDDIITVGGIIIHARPFTDVDTNGDGILERGEIDVDSKFGQSVRKEIEKQIEKKVEQNFTPRTKGSISSGGLLGLGTNEFKLLEKAGIKYEDYKITDDHILSEKAGVDKDIERDRSPWYRGQSYTYADIAEGIYRNNIYPALFQKNISDIYESSTQVPITVTKTESELWEHFRRGWSGNYYDDTLKVQKMNLNYLIASYSKFNTKQINLNTASLNEVLKTFNIKSSAIKLKSLTDLLKDYKDGQLLDTTAQGILKEQTGFSFKDETGKPYTWFDASLVTNPGFKINWTNVTTGTIESDKQSWTFSELYGKYLDSIQNSHKTDEIKSLLGGPPGNHGN